MVSQGAVTELESPRDIPYAELDPCLPSKKLTSAQKDAGDRLRKNIRMNTYNTTLLLVITGSGKTEVYLEAVAECLLLGKQALILIPEIALTVEFLDRLKKTIWPETCTMAFRRYYDRKKALLAHGSRS